MQLVQLHSSGKNQGWSHRRELEHSAQNRQPFPPSCSTSNSVGSCQSSKKQHPLRIEKRLRWQRPDELARRVSRSSKPALVLLIHPIERRGMKQSRMVKSQLDQ